MIIESKLLDEVYVVNCKSFADLRGSFIKIFQDKAFLDQGLNFKPSEISFISKFDKEYLARYGITEEDAAYYAQMPFDKATNGIMHLYHRDKSIKIEDSNTISIYLNTLL